MTRVHPDTLTPPSNGLVVETKKEGGKEESPANDALDSPVREGPARAVGDRVLLALSLEEFQNYRNGTLEKNINGLNAGELAEITFANLEYGNYKVKRDSDGRELFWFKSRELMTKADVDRLTAAEDKADRELEGNVDAFGADEAEKEKKKNMLLERHGAGGGDEIEDYDNNDNDVHRDLGEDRPPQPTINKLTGELIRDLFTHTKSIGAREDVLKMTAALSFRCNLPWFFGRWHIAVFEELKGETFCLEYLSRDLWRDDYVLAGLILELLVPCLKTSDQCCVRFAAALGREVVTRTAMRFPLDTPVCKHAPLVLNHCIVRSARVAKAELARMRQSLCFCGSCRAHFYDHKLYVNGSLQHAIRHTTSAGFGAAPGGPYGSYLRGTVAERSLVPSGDVTFWFGHATVERFRKGLGIERNQKRKELSRFDFTTGRPFTSEELSEQRRLAEVEAERKEKLKRTGIADFRQLQHLTAIMTRFLDRCDVQIAALEVLLHFAAHGDAEALVEANVAEAIAAAMKQHHHGEAGLAGSGPKKKGGISLQTATRVKCRQLQWRACACVARLASRSDALRASLGKKFAIDECLRAFSRCPNDRAVQQQAVFAINYCLCEPGHAATRKRFSDDPYVLRLVAVLLVLKPAEEAVNAKRMAREAAEAQALGTQPMMLEGIERLPKEHESRPPTREDIMHFKDERRAAHTRSRDGIISPIRESKSQVSILHGSSTSATQGKGSNRTQKGSFSSPEETARNAISRELILPVALRMLVSLQQINSFLHPAKEKPTYVAASTLVRKQPNPSKPKFGVSS